MRLNIRRGVASPVSFSQEFQKCRQLSPTSDVTLPFSCDLTFTNAVRDAAMLRRRHGLTITLGRRLKPLHCCRSFTPLCLRQYSSEPPPSHDVAVLGGGITGLAAAYYLARDLPRAKITIYEASDRLGGWLSSSRVPVKDGSVLFEAGPRTLRPSSNGALAAELVRELSTSNVQSKD